MDLEANSGSEAGKPSAGAKRKAPLILVVDDDPAILRFMEMIHAYLDIEIQTAETAEGALELLQTVKFDAMILDCSMPIVDGFEFATLWRKHEKNNGLDSLPIIAMTALRSEEAAKRSWNSGMDAFVAKPLDVTTLKSTIKQLLAKRREAAQ